MSLQAIRLAGALAALAIAIVALSPRSAFLALPLLVAGPIAALGTPAAVRDALHPRGLYAVLLLFTGYLVVNATWSLDRTDAFAKVATFAGYVVAARLAVVGMPRLDERVLDAAARSLVVATAVAAAFLCFEVLSGQAVRRFMATLLPFARPDPKHMQLADGIVRHINSYVLNRHIGLLNLLLWPVLMLAVVLAPRFPLARWLGVGTVAILAIATFRSEHESSMLALLAAAAIFLVHRLSNAGARALVTVGWVVATLLAVPLAHLAFAANLHLIESIPSTGRARIILWSHTAEQVAKAPVLGVGIASTREVDDLTRDEAERMRPADWVIAKRTGRHAHNIYLQAWFETGLVGVALLLAAGLMVLSWIGGLRGTVQGLALAAFTTGAVMATFSWGLWQAWFQAGFVAAALLTALAAEAARRWRG